MLPSSISFSGSPTTLPSLREQTHTHEHRERGSECAGLQAGAMSRIAHSERVSPPSTRHSLCLLTMRQCVLIRWYRQMTAAPCIRSIGW